MWYVHYERNFFFLTLEWNVSRLRNTRSFQIQWNLDVTRRKWMIAFFLQSISNAVISKACDRWIIRETFLIDFYLAFVVRFVLNEIFSKRLRTRSKICDSNSLHSSKINIILVPAMCYSTIRMNFFICLIFECVHLLQTCFKLTKWQIYFEIYF